MAGPAIARLIGAGLVSRAEATASRIASQIRPSDILTGAIGAVTREALAGDEGTDDLEITVPVSSSCISSIGWRPDGVITVDFIRGGTYSYDGSHELFLAFVAAGSKGEFFNRHFR